MGGLRLLLVPMALLMLHSQGFELQDTIHALMEENIHLHDQLDNLTQALRELRRMLWLHSNGAAHPEGVSEEVERLWEDWTQHGISAETHLLLENAFCDHGPSNSVMLLQLQPLVLILLPPSLLLLLGCL